MISKNSHGLDDWEVELLNIFVGMFDSFGLPKSVAQIYGILFCEEDALTQEDICHKLQISAGSASQGLRLLADIGAVHRQSVPGLRGNLFTPERSMKRLLVYFIDVKVRPKLNTGKGQLEALHASLPPGDSVASARIKVLLQWQGRAAKILPVASKLLG